MLDALRCKEHPGLYVDCTVGAGGHAKWILTSSPENRLIGIDWDEAAIGIASENLKAFSGRVTLIREDFSAIKTILEELNIRIGEVDGFLFDLGLSSIQLGTAGRGFSFQEDSPLDMRMDIRKPTRASDLVNKLPGKELERTIKTYGEERWAKRIVSAILRERGRRPIATTRQLADIVCSAVPYSYRRGRIHPATRTFQALRIAVNRELEHLDSAIKDAVGHLRKGGRICVISFHSLEDRIVKGTFRGLKNGVSILTRKPIRPSAVEILNNPRSRSARLRVAEKL